MADNKESATIAFEGFSGLNTDSSRPGIKDNEMWWSDGFMPVGDNKLRTMPDIGAAIFTADEADGVSWFDFGNIGATPIMITVEVDGSIYRTDTETAVTSQIAPDGTLISSARVDVGISQWGSQYILIVARQQNGYFIYDGSILYTAGEISPIGPGAILSGGAGYVSVPTYVVFGGSGSGVVLTPVVSGGSVTALKATNAGSGYLPGEIVQVAFSGGGSDDTPILTATLVSGVISALDLIAGGANYPDGTFALSFSSGGGSGAAGMFTAAGGVVTDVVLTNGGSGYTGSPTVAFPLPGSGATITANLTATVVTSFSIGAGGSSYTPGTFPLTISGGGGSGARGTYTVNPSGVVASTTVVAGGTGYSSPPAVALAVGSGAQVATFVTGGAVDTISVVNGGTNLTGTPLLTIEGGGGIGATAVAVITAGVIASVTVTNGGSGYTTTPAVVVQPGLNNAAYATLNLMPFGITGTALEVYQSRVWVVNGPQVTFSAPSSVTDFSTSSGGGAFTSNDSFLRVAYVQPLQTNGFLYLIADSSVNYIAGVSTSGSPPVTTFTNQNADPEVGTPYPGSVDVLGSDIVFANAFGAHVSYGGKVTKVSEPLDGVYNTVPNFNGQQLSAAKAIVYGKKIWALLLPVIDVQTGDQVNKLFCWDPNRKRWWSTPQGVNLTYVRHQEIASVITAYGSDGTKIYPLFQQPSTTFAKVVKSKLWAKPGFYAEEKSTGRAWLLAQYYSATLPGFILSIDNETGTSPTTITPPGSGLTTGIYVMPPLAIGQNGVLLGMTLTTNAADMAVISMAIDAEITGYRG